MPSSKRKHTRHHDYYRYRNPMAGAMRTVGNVTIGVMGIGAMTAIGFGALGAIKK